MDKRRIEFDEGRLREMAENGADVGEMCKELGACTSTVYRGMKDLGIKRARKKTKKPKPEKVKITNSLPEQMDDGVRKLVEKRRKAVLHFIETGKTDKAHEYVKKYKVPAPKEEKGFRLHLQRVAESMNLPIKRKKEG